MLGRRVIAGHWRLTVLCMCLCVPLESAPLNTSEVGTSFNENGMNHSEAMRGSEIRSTPLTLSPLEVRLNDALGQIQASNQQISNIQQKLLAISSSVLKHWAIFKYVYTEIGSVLGATNPSNPQTGNVGSQTPHVAPDDWTMHVSREADTGNNSTENVSQETFEMPQSDQAMHMDLTQSSTDQTGIQGTRPRTEMNRRTSGSRAPLDHDGHVQTGEWNMLPEDPLESPHMMFEPLFMEESEPVSNETYSAEIEDNITSVEVHDFYDDMYDYDNDMFYYPGGYPGNMGWNNYNGHQGNSGTNHGTTGGNGAGHGSMGGGNHGAGNSGIHRSSGGLGHQGGLTGNMGTGNLGNMGTGSGGNMGTGNGGNIGTGTGGNMGTGTGGNMGMGSNGNIGNQGTGGNIGGTTDMGNHGSGGVVTNGAPGVTGYSGNMQTGNTGNYGVAGNPGRGYGIDRDNAGIGYGLGMGNAGYGYWRNYGNGGYGNYWGNGGYGSDWGRGYAGIMGNTGYGGNQMPGAAGNSGGGAGIPRNGEGNAAENMGSGIGNTGGGLGNIGGGARNIGSGAGNIGGGAGNMGGGAGNMGGGAGNMGGGAGNFGSGAGNMGSGAGNMRGGAGNMGGGAGNMGGGAGNMRGGAGNMGGGAGNMGGGAGNMGGGAGNMGGGAGNMGGGAGNMGSGAGNMGHGAGNMGGVAGNMGGGAGNMGHGAGNMGGGAGNMGGGAGNMGGGSGNFGSGAGNMGSEAGNMGGGAGNMGGGAGNMGGGAGNMGGGGGSMGGGVWNAGGAAGNMGAAAGNNAGSGRNIGGAGGNRGLYNPHYGSGPGFFGQGGYGLFSPWGNENEFENEYEPPEYEGPENEAEDEYPYQNQFGQRPFAGYPGQMGHAGQGRGRPWLGRRFPGRPGWFPGRRPIGHQAWNQGQGGFPGQGNPGIPSQGQGHGRAGIAPGVTPNNQGHRPGMNAFSKNGTGTGILGGSNKTLTDWLVGQNKTVLDGRNETLEDLHGDGNETAEERLNNENMTVEDYLRNRNGTIDEMLRELNETFRERMEDLNETMTEFEGIFPFNETHVIERPGFEFDLENETHEAGENEFETVSNDLLGQNETDIEPINENVITGESQFEKYSVGTGQSADSQMSSSLTLPEGNSTKMNTESNSPTEGGTQSETKDNPITEPLIKSTGDSKDMAGMLSQGPKEDTGSNTGGTNLGAGYYSIPDVQADNREKKDSIYKMHKQKDNSRQRKSVSNNIYQNDRPKILGGVLEENEKQVTREDIDAFRRVKNHFDMLNLEVPDEDATSKNVDGDVEDDGAAPHSGSRHRRDVDLRRLSRRKSSPDNLRFRFPSSHHSQRKGQRPAKQLKSHENGRPPFELSALSVGGFSSDMDPHDSSSELTSALSKSREFASIDSRGHSSSIDSHHMIDHPSNSIPNSFDLDIDLDLHGKMADSSGSWQYEDDHHAQKTVINKEFKFIRNKLRNLMRKFIFPKAMKTRNALDRLNPVLNEVLHAVKKGRGDKNLKFSLSG